MDAAFQALAIDEERSSFGPTPWTSDPRADQHVEHVWFAGVHSDVGGGYPDPALAEIALLWMADRAREFYASGEELIAYVSEDSQPALWALITIYRSLLEKIALKQYDVFTSRPALSTWEKLRILGKGFIKRLT